MRTRSKNVLYTFLILLLCLAAGACTLLHQKKFGKTPVGDRLARIEASPNYRDGEFHNLTPTQILADGQSTMGIILGDLFTHHERLRPEEPLPTVRTILIGPDAPAGDRDYLIWLGHSSFFIHIGGKNLLVDPIFNDHGGPFSFVNKTFPGTDLYTADDMPEIDCLLITHDHWDHLDYETAVALRDKVKRVICPLGVGANFEYWGYPKDKINEEDWWDTALSLDTGLTITLVPARHYSGRLFEKNKTLWTGYVIQTPECKIYLSGDTGYGPHFSMIADKFGTFDLVALDGGQYDPRWPLIHMTPEQAVQAAEEMGAKALLPAHVGRFCISAHPWDEPFIRFAEASKDKKFHLLTPMIGQPVRMNGSRQEFSRWWKDLR